ncbi:hypothetical protein V1505DRAFT_316419, partial [Lipomyces doorenjongii]
ELISWLHEPGLKFVMDSAVNHTSDQVSLKVQAYVADSRRNEWFKSTISSKDSQTKDYDVWKKSKKFLKIKCRANITVTGTRTLARDS